MEENEIQTNDIEVSTEVELVEEFNPAMEFGKGFGLGVLGVSVLILAVNKGRDMWSAHQAKKTETKGKKSKQTEDDAVDVDYEDVDSDD